MKGWIKCDYEILKSLLQEKENIFGAFILQNLTIHVSKNKQTIDDGSNIPVLTLYNNKEKQFEATVI